MIRKGIVMVLVLLLLTQTMFVFAAESYFIQVGAFTSKYNAEKYSNYLSSIGYENEIKNVYGWYKVFVGPFSSEEEANQIKTLLNQAFENGFVVKASEIYENRTPLPTKEEKEDNNEDTSDSKEETSEVNQEDQTSDSENHTDTATDENESNNSDDDLNTTNESIEEQDSVESSSDAVKDESSNLNDNQNEASEDDSQSDDVIVDSLEDFDGAVDYDGKIDQINEPKDYKEFTIVLVTVLWMIFILVILAYRLNQNKK